ncbi:HECT-domain (ubiquitin-transferase) domain-containing protein [Toxoplasma gondii MAS]|uniref:HECT-domain (Ubiquitin-transferase) domain-containing protein n=1 Tax=Toxoplasma gondii MAS TaxID=943118 RepID=A0A086QVM3_TOXGO|nr:HECT-domain (ubiquitin-transferase) domain-containing protein [Toxoplasma gondii MAS]
MAFEGNQDHALSANERSVAGTYPSVNSGPACFLPFDSSAHERPAPSTTGAVCPPASVLPRSPQPLTIPPLVSASLDVRAPCSFSFWLFDDGEEAESEEDEPEKPRCPRGCDWPGEGDWERDVTCEKGWNSGFDSTPSPEPPAASHLDTVSIESLPSSEVLSAVSSPFPASVRPLPGGQRAAEGALAASGDDGTSSSGSLPQLSPCQSERLADPHSVSSHPPRASRVPTPEDNACNQGLARRPRGPDPATAQSDRDSVLACGDERETREEDHSTRRRREEAEVLSPLSPAPSWEISVSRDSPSWSRGNPSRLAGSQTSSSSVAFSVPPSSSLSIASRPPSSSSAVFSSSSASSSSLPHSFSLPPASFHALIPQPHCRHRPTLASPSPDLADSCGSSSSFSSQSTASASHPPPSRTGVSQPSSNCPGQPSPLPPSAGQPVSPQSALLPAPRSKINAGQPGKPRASQPRTVHPVARHWRLVCLRGYPFSTSESFRVLLSPSNLVVVELQLPHQTTTFTDYETLRISLSSKQPVTPRLWTHIAVSIGLPPTSVKLFVDGKEAAKRAVTGRCSLCYGPLPFWLPPLSSVGPSDELAAEEESEDETSDQYDSGAERQTRAGRERQGGREGEGEREEGREGEDDEGEGRDEAEGPRAINTGRRQESGRNMSLGNRRRRGLQRRWHMQQRPLVPEESFDNDVTEETDALGERGLKSRGIGMRGCLADFRVYFRELSQDEVKELVKSCDTQFEREYLELCEGQRWRALAGSASDQISGDDGRERELRRLTHTVQNEAVSRTSPSDISLHGVSRCARSLDYTEGDRQAHFSSLLSTPSEDVHLNRRVSAVDAPAEPVRATTTLAPPHRPYSSTSHSAPLAACASSSFSPSPLHSLSSQPSSPPLHPPSPPPVSPQPSSLLLSSSPPESSSLCPSSFSADPFLAASLASSSSSSFSSQPASLFAPLLSSSSFSSHPSSAASVASSFPASTSLTGSAGGHACLSAGSLGPRHSPEADRRAEGEDALGRAGSGVSDRGDDDLAPDSRHPHQVLSFPSRRRDRDIFWGANEADLEAGVMSLVTRRLWVTPGGSDGNTRETNPSEEATGSSDSSRRSWRGERNWDLWESLRRAVGVDPLLVVWQRQDRERKATLGKPGSGMYSTTGRDTRKEEEGGEQGEERLHESGDEHELEGLDAADNETKGEEAGATTGATKNKSVPLQSAQHPNPENSECTGASVDPATEADWCLTIPSARWILNERIWAYIVLCVNGQLSEAESRLSLSYPSPPAASFSPERPLAPLRTADWASANSSSSGERHADLGDFDRIQTFRQTFSLAFVEQQAGLLYELLSAGSRERRRSEAGEGDEICREASVVGSFDAIYLEPALQLSRAWMQLLLSTLHCVAAFAPWPSQFGVLLSNFRSLLPHTLKQWIFHLSLSMTEDAAADGRIRVVINRAKALKAAEGRTASPHQRSSFSYASSSSSFPTSSSVWGERQEDDCTRSADDPPEGGSPATHAAWLRDFHTVFGQLYRQLSDVSPKRLRSHGRAWYVVYDGEGGIDAGGIYRDSLAHIAQELQSPFSPLFMPCSNSRGFGDNQDRWVPSPRCVSPSHLSMFRFLGRLMGVAVRGRLCLDLNLSGALWKPVVGLSVGAQDLEAVDALCVQMLQTVCQLHSSQGAPERFTEEFPLFWHTTLSDGRVEELRVGGKDLPVRWEERADYARRTVACRLEESREQVAEIRKGIGDVIPLQFVNLLCPAEMERMVCGSAEIDLDLLKAHTRYTGFLPTDPVIIWFWEVLFSFSTRERQKFLRFVWGRSRLPPARAAWEQDMEVARKHTTGRTAAAPTEGVDFPPQAISPPASSDASSLTSPQVESQSVALHTASPDTLHFQGAELRRAEGLSANASSSSGMDDSRSVRFREEGESRLAGSGERRTPVPFAARPEDLQLPASHTCFFQIELPCYSRKEILREKLLYAITEGIAIDADNMADSAAWQ